MYDNIEALNISIFEKMNKKAHNFEITKSVFLNIISIAFRIYDKEKVSDELINLVKLANSKAETNSVGFMIHIIRDKEKIYNSGGDPSIKLDLLVQSKEVLPDWFKDRKNKEIEIEKT